MPKSHDLESLRIAARKTLAAHDELLDVFQHIEERKLAASATTEDMELLCDLVSRKIYPTNALGILLLIDLRVAIDAIIARYAGASVDPDKKFGGYTFELSSILEDVYENSGRSGIERLICHPEFPADQLDKRLVTILCETLSFQSEEELVAWVGQLKDQARGADPS